MIPAFLDGLLAGCWCKYQHLVVEIAFVMHDIKEWAYIQKTGLVLQQEAGTNAHLALYFMASNRDFRLWSVLCVGFGLMESEAGNQDMLVFGDDEILVPCIDYMCLTVSSAGCYDNDAVVDYTIMKNLVKHTKYLLIFRRIL